MIPDIRVGVPIYHGARWLGQTLQCIQEQTDVDIEVLLSIDGGDDESLAACQPFLDDPRFRVVSHGQRLGWSGNLNYLMQTAQTEFFCYWQQDDFASTNYLERLHATMVQRPDAAIAYTDVQWFGRTFGRETLASIEGFPRHRVKQYMREQHWIPLRGLMRCELLEQVPPAFQLHLGSPWENGLLSYLAGLGPLLRVEDAMYFKRSHTDAWSTSFQLRPRHQRHRDWVVRGQTLNAVLDEFRGDSSSMECLEYTLDRFCTVRPGLFHDSPDPDPGAVARFLRDWHALGGQLPALPPAAGTAGAAQAPLLRVGILAALADCAARSAPAEPGESWVMGRAEAGELPGHKWLGYGWSHPEPWGVWTDGPSASLWAPTVSQECNLHLLAFHYGPANTEVEFAWTVAGSMASGSVRATTNEAVAWSVPIGPGDSRVDLSLPSAVSPKEAGLSPDDRELGLGLVSMALTL